MVNFVNFCLKYCSRSALVTGHLLTRPCQGILAQRIERSVQLWSLYSKIYSRRAVSHMLTRIRSSIHTKVAQNAKSRHLLLLLAGSTPIIKLEKSATVVNEDNIDEFLIDALHCLQGTDKNSCSSRKLRDHIEGITRSASTVDKSEDDNTTEKKWELFCEADQVQVWRRKVEDRPSHLCEYLIHGSFTDIQPVAFHQAQTNLEYRREWDTYTKDLEVIKSDERSDKISWIVHFPFPLAPREYILYRQFKIDTEKNMIVALNKTIGEEELEISGKKKTVRVSEYYSLMVIVPHSTMDNAGLDFVLLYYDDPQIAPRLSKCAQAAGGSSGMASWLSRLRKAALALQEKPEFRIQELLPEQQPANATSSTSPNSTPSPKHSRSSTN